MANRYDALMQRIQNGEIILIDGATGTEVERRGVPQVDHAWNGGGALTHPDIVRAVHTDYIERGAQIIISNTFATNRNCLDDAGWEEHFDALNRRGVALAVEAREASGTDHVLVAAGMSHWDFNNNPPTLAALQANAAEQAAIMVEAGADLFMLEMMVHIDKMRVLIEETSKTGLPVWVGMSIDLDDDGRPKLWHKGAFEDAVDICKAHNVPLINIMHTQVEDVAPALDVLQTIWDKPVGVYAHSGIFEDGKWIFESVITPDEYCAFSAEWLQRGVNIIGGCCGVGIRHIAALQTMLQA